MGWSKPGCQGRSGADQLVNPLHLADGIRVAGRARSRLFPADQEHAELGAPIPEVIVGDNPVAQQASMRARESPRMVERMWPTCIGLATLGELKSTTTVRGARQCFARKGVRPGRRPAAPVPARQASAGSSRSRPRRFRPSRTRRRRRVWRRPRRPIGVDSVLRALARDIRALVW